jgi:hypothetical protein
MRCICTFLVVVSLSSLALARGKGNWSQVEQLKPGTQIWVEQWNGVTWAGRLDSADRSALRLAPNHPFDGHPVEVIYRSDVRQIVHLRRRFLLDPHSWLAGSTLIGAAAGTTVGAVHESRGGAKGSWLIGGLGGAGIGFFGGCVSEAGFGLVALFRRDKVVYDAEGASMARSSVL